MSGGCPYSEAQLLAALERLHARRPELRLEYPLAERWLARGDVEAARRVCEEGLAAKPGYYQLHLTLGKIAEREGERQAAADHYRAVLAACPGNLYAARRLLELEPEAAAAEGGSEPASVSRSRPPEDPFTNPTMAELYAAQGHTGKAIAIYRTLVRRHPGDARLAARLAELEQGA